MEGDPGGEIPISDKDPEGVLFGGASFDVSGWGKKRQNHRAPRAITETRTAWPNQGSILCKEVDMLLTIEKRRYRGYG